MDDREEKAIQVLADAYHITPERLRTWLVDEAQRAETRRQNGGKGGRPTITDELGMGVEFRDRPLWHYEAFKFFAPVHDDGTVGPDLSNAEALKRVSEFAADEIVAAGKVKSKDRHALAGKIERSIRNRYSSWKARQMEELDCEGGGEWEDKLE